jgi:hypothetical protein
VIIPAGPGPVVSGPASPDMTKRTRDPARQGTGGVTAGAVPEAFLDAGSAAGGVLHDSYGLGSALIVAILIAALGALTLLSRGGAAISSDWAGSVDMAARGREAAALSHCSVDEAATRVRGTL